MPKRPKFGTETMMNKLEVQTGGPHIRDLTVYAYGNPMAMIFKESARSKLQASVCGTCGYTELYAVDPHSLRQAAQAGEKRWKEKPWWATRAGDSAGRDASRRRHCARRSA